jgi:hypothetical protein
MTIPQLEEAILADVVTSYVNLKQSSPRWPLLVKYKNQPAAQAIANLANQNIIRRKDAAVPTEDEEFLPAAAAFEFCGIPQFRDTAELAATIVLHVLQQMFVGERKKEGYVFEDLKKHFSDTNPNRSIEDVTLKLALYLARDLHMLLSSRLNKPDETGVEWFRISEAVTNMPEPETEWDKAMAGFRRRGTTVLGEDEEGEEASWEEIRRLGGGGQSEVFLVRCPARASARTKFLQTIRKALYADKEADLGNAIAAYARPELPSELGAM